MSTSCLKLCPSLYVVSLVRETNASPNFSLQIVLSSIIVFYTSMGKWFTCASLAEGSFSPLRGHMRLGNVEDSSEDPRSRTITSFFLETNFA